MNYNKTIAKNLSKTFPKMKVRHWNDEHIQGEQIIHTINHINGNITHIQIEVHLLDFNGYKASVTLTEFLIRKNIYAMGANNFPLHEIRFTEFNEELIFEAIKELITKAEQTGPILQNTNGSCLFEEIR